MNCGHKHPVRTHSFASWKTSDYFTRVTQVDIRRIGSICRRVARQSLQRFQHRMERLRTPVRRAHTIRSRTERLRTSVRRTRTIRSRRESTGSPCHHRRPTNEQRIAASSSKTDANSITPRHREDLQTTVCRALLRHRKHLQTVVCRAPPPLLQPTPESNPSSVSNRDSQLQFFTSRQCSIETATISHASPSPSTTIERI